MFLPPQLTVLLIAVVMTVPFYFYNNYLTHKIQPRQSGKKFLLYAALMITSAFIYISAGIMLIIAIAKAVK